MRVSADSNNPAYSPLAHWLEVRLDGNVLSNVMTADDVRGTVEVELRDAWGQPVLEGGKVKTAIWRGFVSINVLPSAPAWMHDTPLAELLDCGRAIEAIHLSGIADEI